MSTLTLTLTGIDRPPTLDEVRAHEAQGGDWINETPTGPESWYLLATGDDEIFARRELQHYGRVLLSLPAGRWWRWLGGGL